VPFLLGNIKVSIARCKFAAALSENLSAMKKSCMCVIDDIAEKWRERGDENVKVDDVSFKLFISFQSIKSALAHVF
jgi:hypothetical protein